MEPTSIAMAFNVFGKAFNVGLAAYKVRKEWEVNADAVEAVASLFGESGDLVGMLPSGGGREALRLFARHAVLVTYAFSAACRDHWAGNTEMAPIFDKSSRLRAVFQSKGETEKARDVQSRLKRALDRVGVSERQDASKTFDLVSALVGEPLGSPWYQALWEAFTNPLLEDGQRSGWLELKDPGARLEFECAYCLAYADVLMSSAGADVARGVLQVQASRPDLLRELLVRGMSTWDRSHVFGADGTPGVPMMPLGDIYVEPDATCKVSKGSHQGQRRAPILELIHELREEHNVIIVRGDFGHGKSLTARILACEWAKKYLTSRTVSSPELIFPIFIKCGEDFRSHSTSLKEVVARALRRQANALGLDNLRKDEGAFALPPTNQRVVYLVDGLDEVVLTASEIDDFFSELQDTMTRRQTAIVFSRKGVIPHPEKLRRIPVVDVQPFRTAGETPGAQVAEWLEKWNGLSGKPPIRVEQLKERNLLDVVTTPIVLFMAAITWDAQGEAGAPLAQAEIYEKFFRQIAAGKCKQDEDQHGPVIESSRAVLARLLAMKEVSAPKPSEDDPTAHALAMLWLMARVAWEGQRCAAKGNDLTLHEVTTILRAELEIHNDSKVEELIRMGVLLVLQADHRGGNDRILFGHKSFREFLVARYWAGQLRKIVAARHDKRKEIEANLLGARLLGSDDGTLAFLLQILNGSEWDSSARSKVVEWAEDCFNEESPNPSARTWLDDQRPVLREAALAIGSSVQGTPGISAMTPTTLRTMLGWFWLHALEPIVIAPRLSSAGAVLRHVRLNHANLEDANLEGADFTGAKLHSVHLLNARLEGAEFVDANLPYSCFVRANIAGADFSEANLTHANLNGANLEGAVLNNANLYAAQLGDANVADASFIEADLRGAVLKGTSFLRADLQGADLRAANLTGANLIGAGMEGADLRTANLSGVLCDQTTVWPSNMASDNDP